MSGGRKPRSFLPLLTPLFALTATGAAVGAPFPSVEAVREALAAVKGADLVVFDQPHRGRRPRVLAAAVCRATVPRIRELLRDPAAYRRAVPALRRAEMLGTRSGPHGPERLVGWELEIPLWNLEGRLWLRPLPAGAELELLGGDLAPGTFRITAQPAPEGTVISLEAQANVREASWLTRRLAARSPHAEPAMTAAAAYVLLRAIILEAERTLRGPDRRRWPRDPIRPPARASLDGKALGEVTLARLAATHATAAVRSRPEGRLDRIEIAVFARRAPAALQEALARPRSWRALPGWRSIESTPGRRGEQRWKVDTRMPFVDFDAVWAMTPGPPLRAEATSGPARGAVFGWDVLPGGAPRTAVAVLSRHPRLDRTGYLPRKFIEADPLLEHGLSLGLAYVEALSLIQPSTRD